VGSFCPCLTNTLKECFESLLAESLLFLFLVVFKIGVFV